MAEERVQRRLAAILAADVVSYSRLMEQDEAGTLAALKSLRKAVLEPLVARHQGRIFKTTGDGVLVEFASAVNAVQCATDLQQGMADANSGRPEDRRIVLRIGVNLGDVMVEGGDLYGDGVNIAARLENLAEPGGISVSAGVYEQVRRKLDCHFDDLGDQPVKNIAEPLHVYRVRTAPPLDPAAEPAGLPLPSKPSIAVLPFNNLSGDPAQESFADGLSEDLITDLSRTAGLFVIARNSTFAYKGKHTDVRQIARDLGVRYILEGSARRSGGRVRINAQLIDSVKGTHLWAERFDRDLQDIFAIQDEVTAKIVEALVGMLTIPPPRNRPKNMEAYELCLRARSTAEQSPLAAREGALLLQRAIALDPGYAEAHWRLAHCMWTTWGLWFGTKTDHRAAIAMAERAVALDPNDANGRWMHGYLLAYDHQFDKSDREFAAALRLDPNNADAWANLSDLSVCAGKHQEGLDQIQKAFRLNPQPEAYYYWLLGHAYYALRQYQAAIETLRKDATYRTGSRRILAASLAQAGHADEARHEAELYMLTDPEFRISDWAAVQPSRDEATRQHFVEGYRKAGLPE
jgi:TolB-like protein/Flp pilus assembly protein TadD